MGQVSTGCHALRHEKEYAIPTLEELIISQVSSQAYNYNNKSDRGACPLQAFPSPPSLILSALEQRLSMGSQYHPFSPLPFPGLCKEPTLQVSH